MSESSEKNSGDYVICCVDKPDQVVMNLRVDYLTFHLNKHHQWVMNLAKETVVDYFNSYLHKHHQLLSDELEGKILGDYVNSCLSKHGHWWCNDCEWLWSLSLIVRCVWCG